MCGNERAPARITQTATASPPAGGTATCGNPWIRDPTQTLSNCEVSVKNFHHSSSGRTRHTRHAGQNLKVAGPNPTRPPLRGPSVRGALSAGTDRGRVASALLSRSSCDAR